MLWNLDITSPEKVVSMLRFLKAAAAKKGSTSAGMTEKFHSEKKQFFLSLDGGQYAPVYPCNNSNSF